jgi:hypothetical protein
MRRTSGIRVATIAVLAVLLVALSVGSGMFALPSVVSVRTATGAHADSARTSTAAAAVRPMAPHPGMGSNGSNQTNLTAVNITPLTSSVAPNGHTILTATLVCQLNSVNITCPSNVTANVTYTWSVANAFAGSLNESNLSTVQFNASGVPSTTTVDVTASLVNVTGLNNSTVTAPAATINVFAPGDPAISIAFTTNFSVYMLVPWTLSFTVTVTNGSVGPSSTWVNVNVRDLIPTCGSQYSFLGAPPCPQVINVSLPVTSGVNTFSYTMNYSHLDSAGYANPTAGVFPSDVYQFIAWVSDNNGVGNVTAGLEQNAYLVFHTPTGVFNNPVPGTSLSTGNLTFAVTYTGDYIQAAELSVKNATGQVVFLAAVFAVGQGNRTVVVDTAWLAVTPGAYTAAVNVSTPYGSYLFSQKYTVIPAGQEIYINQTSYHNASLFGSGVSQGLTGMLLLVIGLIIGLVVALVLGRMMWGTPSQPSSPQPWSPTSSGDSSGGTGGSGGSGGSTSSSSTGSSDMSSEGSTTDK